MLSKHHIDLRSNGVNVVLGTLLSPGARGEKRGHGEIVDTDEVGHPRKKKYAKEAWPGRKPGPGQGLF